MAWPRSLHPSWRILDGPAFSSLCDEEGSLLLPGVLTNLTAFSWQVEPRESGQIGQDSRQTVHLEAVY
jgi:hypothetical protein